jgi:hypothetical protein
LKKTGAQETLATSVTIAKNFVCMSIPAFAQGAGVRKGIDKKACETSEVLAEAKVAFQHQALNPRTSELDHFRQAAQLLR